ncbi:putative oxidoreductase GLYR1 [Nymphon striatum]|nr:putative oxidoreductase GLYR1 [Nymphon striatum]
MCADFEQAGANKEQTPADVIAACDITFSCVSDPQASKDMVFGNCGVLQEMKAGKSYVEMTSIDSETSQDINEAITARGGRYLESPVSGSKCSAEEGTLILMCSGEKSLFEDCSTCFNAMGEHAFYLGRLFDKIELEILFGYRKKLKPDAVPTIKTVLSEQTGVPKTRENKGEIGNASKMNLIVNLILGTTMAGLAEGMALADRAGLMQKDLLEILEQSSLSCPIFTEKGKAIIDGSFSTSCPLQHLQKDLRLVLALGDQMEQPLPITASANEVFKHAKRLGYGEHDMSAVYIRARF